MGALAVLAAALSLAGTPSSALRLHQVTSIGGDISPKSIVASQTGLFFAQNMIYKHTITVYDRSFRLVKTLDDFVNLGRMGYPQYFGWFHGGPVEAAFTPDHRYAYVTNYSMYGPGLTHPGDDVCSPSSGYDRSFVYRVDVKSLTIDRVAQVGSVPKYVAVTPDDRYVLVTNWCSYDLSVVSVATNHPLRRIPLGAYPRGIAVDSSSQTAYIAVMGSSDIARVDLRTFAVSWIRGVGNAPRHLVLDPVDSRYLYVTLNGENDIAKVDLNGGRVVAKVSTGTAPRSMTIAPDGRSLYVVNYFSSSMSKVRTSDMHVLQTVPTAGHPIGITYDDATREVWVSCYDGAIDVFKDG